jgi:hypothetical protein
VPALIADRIVRRASRPAWKNLLRYRRGRWAKAAARIAGRCGRSYCLADHWCATNGRGIGHAVAQHQRAPAEDAGVDGGAAGEAISVPPLTTVATVTPRPVWEPPLRTVVALATPP